MVQSSIIRPHRFFVFMGLLYGLAMIFITPPFQVPDEINHWYRAYQISTGQLLPEMQDNRLGGHLPYGVIEVTQPFLTLRGNMNAKTRFQTVKDQFLTGLLEDQTVFIDFPNTALYSPVSYLPQAIGILLARTLGLGPIIIFYTARIFTLWIWIAVIAYAIKVIPMYKWLMALLALLPMSVFINMSLSADMVTNTISFLLIACVLKFSFADSPFTLKRLSILLLLGITLASAKMVYTPLILLMLIIPGEKYVSKRFRWLVYMVLSLSAFGTAYFWSAIVNDAYIPYANYNPAFRDNLDLVKCGSIQEQMDFILSHNFYIVGVFFKSLWQTFDMYYEGYVGTFGWLDTRLPNWSILITYLVIMMASLFPIGEEAKMRTSQKIILFSVSLIAVSLILLSQHLTWDCVGSEIISTIQGRYFIPVFPLLFFCLRMNYAGSVRIIQGIVIVWVVFLLSLSVRKLYHRYYIDPIFEELSLYCGAESVIDQKFLKTSIPKVVLENADTRSTEKSRSGDYSLKLDVNNPYGFTYRTHDWSMGDVIQVSVWRFGEGGSIVISGDGGNQFYLGSSAYSEMDSSGWMK